LDFTQPDSFKKLLEHLKTAGVTKLHVLVNNSGVSWGEPLLKYSEKGWNKVMDVNLKVMNVQFSIYLLIEPKII